MQTVFKAMKVRTVTNLGILQIIFTVCAGSLTISAAETNSVTTNTTESAGSQEVLRTYLQLQEQLHSAQLAIETNRKEANQAAAQNAEILANRLKAIEEALAQQRTREMETMQSSNRVMLIVAGTFATLGFLAIVVMTFFQWRTVNRLAEISAMPVGRGLMAPEPIAALEGGHGTVVTVSPSEESNVRLLGAIDRLEKRLHELEHTNADSTSEKSDAVSNGDISGSVRENGKSLDAIMGRGQSYLNMERPEDALACFNEALEHHPNHAEAWVKKGVACENLRRLDEALECYNKAIAADQFLTMAYLHKGSICNRLERHTEALECYEMALRTQEAKPLN